jgi:hypothetical protein
MPVDEHLLNEELRWRRQKGVRWTPNGVSVMQGLTAAIVVPLGGLGLELAVALKPANELVSVALLVIVCGVALFMSNSAARWLWVAIGPVARTLLRPLGVLGFWPTVLLVFFLVSFPFALLRAGRAGVLNRGPFKGPGWVALMADEGRGRFLEVKRSDAEARCHALGMVLPTLEEASRVAPQWAGYAWNRAGPFHLEHPTSPAMTVLREHPRNVAPSDEDARYAVCVERTGGTERASPSTASTAHADSDLESMEPVDSDLTRADAGVTLPADSGVTQPADAAAVEARSPPRTLWMYEDAQGVTHVTDRFEEIPRKARARARRISE